MNRLVPISGFLAAVSGAAWLVPAIAARMERGDFAWQDYSAVSVGPLLIIGGAAAAWRGFHDLRLAAIPSEVRLGILCNGLFVSFCVLEFSDGLLRQNGRILYWTSVVFLPSLMLFYGQALAQRWAWWGARIVTALFAVWFSVFLALIPFAHLRGNGGAAPWWGKIYAIGVTLVFAGGSICAFRALGRPEARRFYKVRPARPEIMAAKATRSLQNPRSL